LKVTHLTHSILLHARGGIFAQILTIVNCYFYREPHKCLLMGTWIEDSLPHYSKLNLCVHGTLYRYKWNLLLLSICILARSIVHYVPPIKNYSYTFVPFNNAIFVCVFFGTMIPIYQVGHTCKRNVVPFTRYIK